jgi:hypothetical protein
MLSEPVTPSLARRALGSSPQGESFAAMPAEVADSTHVRVLAIQEAICTVCGVSKQDLLSSKRSSRISHARQLAMYLTRRETELSLAQIAREFNRDHTTVLHAIRSVSARLEPGSETAASLQRTCELLGELRAARPPNPGAVHRELTHPTKPSTTTSSLSLP